MDNITHSLVGLVEAELILHGPSGLRRRLPPTITRVVAVAANNFPDLDFFITPLIPGRLGYLLHHRGHTHTLLGAAGLALLLTILVGGWTKWRHPDVNWRESAGPIFVVALIGFWLHILMDSFNSYGVHPFWPWDNHWYYGDTLFIIEPWLWGVLLPLAMASERKWIAWPAGAVWLFALGFVWWGGAIPGIMAVVITLTSGLVAAAVFRFPNARGGTALVGMLLVIGVFGAASQSVRRQIWDRLSTENAGRRIEDLVLSPLPANPFCWAVTTVEIEPSTDDYISRRGYAVLSPRWSDVNRCRLIGDVAPVEPRTPTSDESLRWKGEQRMRRRELAEIAKSSCEVSAFLQFARVPLVARVGAEIVAGDGRFRMGVKRSFSEFTLRPDHPCPRNLPPWIPPRHDLLD
jgi:inner membrane protein